MEFHGVCMEFSCFCPRSSSSSSSLVVSPLSRITLRACDEAVPGMP